MANENVKIVIKEVNETSPQGAGASSDIVYIPGFAVDGAISKNVPVLCNSIAEFEYHFGDKPYTFTEKDVYKKVVTKTKGAGTDTVKYDANSKVDNNYNGYLPGALDISYIYAKELLNAGLSVYYENICFCDDEYNDAVEELTKDQNRLNTVETKITAAEATKKSADNVKVTAEEALSKAKSLPDSDPTKEAAIKTSEASLKVAIENCEEAEKELKYLVDELKALEEYLGTDAKKIATEKSKLDNMHDMGKIEYLYTVLSDRLSVLEDKDEYTVKYITTGGYPTFYNYEDHTENTLADKLIEVAYKRGDAVALVDHSDAPNLPLDPFNRRSIYYAVNKHTWAHGTFGAMFTPYGKYSCMTVADDTTTDDNESLQIMPASFGYLKCLASAIKTSPNWLAMAGVARGLVPNLQELNTKQLMSNIIAEDYQPKFGGNVGNAISINAITTIKPYGLTVWGNRTLERVDPKGTTALNFLNTRNMISDIKKLSHQTAKSLMFEQDSDELWLDFKSKVSPLLEQLKTGYGISDYQIVKATTKYNGEPLTKGELAAVIRIFPLYAVEYFDITVVISDDES